MKSFKIILGILIFAFLPVLPQLIFGYGGDDFRLHVPSWLELHHLWQAGIFGAGWASQANFGLGDLRFLYYPPVSFLAGAGLASVLPFALVPAAFVWLAAALAGVAMYLASKDFVAEEDRWKAALLYMASPYLIDCLLVRFAASEALTLIWLPLLLLNFYKTVWHRQFRPALLLGILLALTWLTNIPASIVLLYLLFPVVLAACFYRRSPAPVLFFLGAEGLAGALSAFYLLPTWIEQVWIQKDQVLRFSFANYFIFARHIQEPFQIFIIEMWSFAVFDLIAISVCAYAARRTLEDKNLPRTAVAVALVGFFFQLPISVFLWRHLPQLEFAGFPFRFLAPMGAVLPLLLLARGGDRKWRLPVYIATGLLLLVIVRQYHANNWSRDNFSQQTADWQSFGYGGWQEFVPAGGTRATEPANVPQVAVLGADSNPRCTVTVQSWQAEQRVLQTDSATSCRVRLATYFYPYWRATDESGVALPLAKDVNALTVVSAPAGRHIIRLTFAARSPARMWSSAISVSVLLLTALTLFLVELRTSRARSQSSALPLEPAGRRALETTEP